MLNKGDLVVSCQALEDEPLHSSFIMAKMALAAKQGGAQAIRANSVKDIKAIKQEVNLPVIGIIKRVYPGSDIHITASLKEVSELYEVGVDVIALDATDRLRPDNVDLTEFFNQIKSRYPNQKLMADCSTIAEMKNAEKLGFDYIGTTLFGYTPYSPVPIMDNDAELMIAACNEIKTPIIAEGNINSPELAKLALDLGCFCVVVGSMITRPQLITRKFASAIE